MEKLTLTKSRQLWDVVELKIHGNFTWQNSQPYTVLGQGNADTESYKVTRVLVLSYLTKTSCPDTSTYLGDTSSYEIVYDLYVITLNPRIGFPQNILKILLKLGKT